MLHATRITIWSQHGGGGRRPAEVWMLHATWLVICSQHYSLDFTILRLMVEHLKIRWLRTRPMVSARNGRSTTSSSQMIITVGGWRRTTLAHILPC
jgi:hypothetical protein